MTFKKNINTVFIIEKYIIHPIFPIDAAQYRFKRLTEVYQNGVLGNTPVASPISVI